MNQTHQLVVPDWIFQASGFVHRNWTAVLGVVIVALLSAVITEFAKHKWSVKYEEDRAKQIIRWTLLVVSSGFTALGYFIWFAQQNSSTLKQLPYIGQAEVEVLGAAWGLYNFRLNKTFKNVSQKLANWSGSKTTGQPVVTAEGMHLPEEESQFQSL